MSYTIQELDRMIALAKELGFWDDVAHWTALRKILISSTYGK